MHHSIPSRFTILAVLTVVGGGVALQSARSGAPAGGSASDPSAIGTVAVTGITLPGQAVELSEACAETESQTARVVCAADAFLVTLTEAQQAAVLLEATQENAVVWSNIPAIVAPRLGLAMSTLSGEQRDAALTVLKAATGSATDDGYGELTQLLMADDVLNASGWTPPPPEGASGGPASEAPPPPSGPIFSSGAYHLAFLGTPSTTGTWHLQFGGHHIAVNTTYRAGEVASPTPAFVGAEPLVWTAEDATYAPFTAEYRGMADLLASFSDAQLGAAQLSETFTDVLLGPGQDGRFPETKAGIAVSDLSDEQQALVLAAMVPLVQDADDATAAALLAIYEAELAETYIAFSGDPSLTNNTDYVRIDGPSVWMEFLAQTGIVYADQIHYHAIWRDHERDYGAEYNF